MLFLFHFKLIIDFYFILHFWEFKTFFHMLIDSVVISYFFAICTLDKNLTISETKSTSLA